MSKMKKKNKAVKVMAAAGLLATGAMGTLANASNIKANEKGETKHVVSFDNKSFEGLGSISINGNTDGKVSVNDGKVVVDVKAGNFGGLKYEAKNLVVTSSDGDAKIVPVKDGKATIDVNSDVKLDTVFTASENVDDKKVMIDPEKDKEIYASDKEVEAKEAKEAKPMAMARNARNGDAVGQYKLTVNLNQWPHAVGVEGHVYNFNLGMDSKTTAGGSRRVFCIEPKQEVLGWATDYKDWHGQGEINSKLSLYGQRAGYLGYYAPHAKATGDGVKLDNWDPLAAEYTQTIVWEAMHAKGIKPSAGYSGWKKKIDAKIADWDKKPSFNQQTIDLKEGETKVIKDTNNQLAQYEGIKDGQTYDLGNGISATINKKDNSVSLKAGALPQGKKEVVSVFDGNKHDAFKYKPYAAENHIFVSPTSQDVMEMASVDKQFFGFNVRVKCSNDPFVLKIQKGIEKEDTAGKESMSSQTKIALDGVEFTAKYYEGDPNVSVDSLTGKPTAEATWVTDKNGLIDFQQKPAKGEWAVKLQNGDKVYEQNAVDAGVIIIQETANKNLALNFDPNKKYIVRVSKDASGKFNKTYEGFSTQAPIIEGAQVVTNNKVEIKTNASDVNGEQGVSTVDKKLTVVDKVSYDDLKPGKEYEMKAELHLRNEDGSDGGVIATQNVKFTPEKSSGVVEVVFKDIDAEKVKGKTAVAFETLTQNGKTLVTHADINDEDQSVWFPALGTKLADVQGNKDISVVDDEVIIEDTVDIDQLEKGKVYLVKGELHHKKGNEDKGAISNAEKYIKVDEENNVVECDAKGNVITGDEDKVTGETDVEKPETDIEKPEENKPEVQPQTREVTAENKDEVKDEVKDEEDEAKDDIKEEVLGDIVLVDGQVKVQFKVNPKDFAGDDLVAFEELYPVDENGKPSEKPVAEHKDINDKNQTVELPKIGTTLTGVDGNKVVANEKVTLHDTVEYHNLIPGKEYTLKGTLVDAKGNPIEGAVGETTFTPDKPDGEVVVEFKDVDLTKAQLSDKVVAFEELQTPGICAEVDDNLNPDKGEEKPEEDTPEDNCEDRVVADHKDVNDDGQTVTVKPNPEPVKGEDKTTTTTSVNANTGMVALGGLGVLGIAGAYAISRKRKGE